VAGRSVNGCPPPLLLPSAADLIELRGRIDAEAGDVQSCPAIEWTPEQTHPAEIDGVGWQILLRHAEGELASIPGSVEPSVSEKRMLPPGPVLASAGCLLAGGRGRRRRPHDVAGAEREVGARRVREQKKTEFSTQID
jgi:hypothetical protein